jgi:putative ABC transport system permease protein
MNKAVNELYKNQNLMDSKIVSTLGLTNKDLELLKNNHKILDFYPTHTIDANLENLNSVVRFMEYDKKNDINKFIVVDGRLPENSGEIALDEHVLKNNKNSLSMLKGDGDFRSQECIELLKQADIVVTNNDNGK